MSPEILFIYLFIYYIYLIYSLLILKINLSRFLFLSLFPPLSVCMRVYACVSDPDFLLCLDFLKSEIGWSRADHSTQPS